MKDDNLGGLGLGLAVLVGFYCFAGCMEHRKSQENTRNAIEQRGYLVPQRFRSPELVDLDRDGNPESIAQYKGRTFLARVDTNGTPYFVPYRIMPEKEEK